ncbi:MAG: NUDIX hydrolase [Candidatus Hydrogenedentes bacterium]|nr:NUDIX hydrolase [Candidatus Hydrogenedentota bacterium]
MHRPNGEIDVLATAPAGIPEKVAAAMPRVRMAAIIVEDDRLLLVRHSKADRSYWLLPGGGLEFGESMEAALRRELMEEANLEIRVKDLVMANDTIDPNGSRHVINLYFTAEVLSGELRCGNDHRLEEVRFVPLREVPSLHFYPDTRPALLPAIQAGFPGRAAYLGNLWKEQ